MTSTLALAEHLAAVLTSAIDDPDVLVTLDPTRVTGARRAGAVLISPPTLSYPAASTTIRDATFEVYLIAGSGAKPLEAWRRLDELLAAALTALPVRRAEPATWQPLNAPGPVPAYTLTTHPIDE